MLPYCTLVLIQRIEASVAWILRVAIYEVFDRPSVSVLCGLDATTAFVGSTHVGSARAFSSRRRRLVSSASASLFCSPLKGNGFADGVDE